MTSAPKAMQKGDLPAAPVDAHGRISKKTVELDGVTVTEETRTTSSTTLTVRERSNSL